MPDDQIRIEETNTSVAPTFRGIMNGTNSVLSTNPHSSVIGGVKLKNAYLIPTATLNEENLAQYREALETKLGITRRQFEITEAFVQPWYPSGDKNRRYKLGSLSLCQFNSESDDKHLCRVLKFERITAYQMEGYYTELARFHMSKLTRYMVFPKGIYVDDQNSIHLVVPKRKSLYELIHQADYGLRESSSPSMSNASSAIQSYTKLVIMT